MRTLGRTGLALITLFLFVVLAPAALAGLPETGDLIVVDSNGWWGGGSSNPPGGRVLKIDPATGAQSIISSGGFLKAPWGLAIDCRGDIIVSDHR